MGDLLPGNLVSSRVLGEASGGDSATLRRDALPLEDYTSAEKLQLERERLHFRREAVAGAGGDGLQLKPQDYGVVQGGGAGARHYAQRGPT